MKLNTIVKIFSLGVTVLISSCKPSQEEAIVETAKQKEKKSFPVKVLRLQKNKVDKTVEYAASLQAYEKVDLAPSIPGQIEKIYVEIGDRVKKGQLLVLMDDASLKQAEYQLKNIETEYKRYDKVQKVGALSKQVFDATQTNKSISAVQVQNLRKNTRLVAPFDGVVTGKYFEDGEIYSGSPTSSSGKPAIVTIMQIDRLKAYLNISEVYYSQVKRGKEINFVMDALPGKVFTGKVNIKYPTIDEASRTFTVEAVLRNTGYQLRPGMYSKIELHLGETEVYLVPYLAALKQQGSNERYIYTCENGKAIRKTVTIGKRYNEYIEIINNEIDTNTQIIYAGHLNLKNGDLVEIIK